MVDAAQIVKCPSRSGVLIAVHGGPTSPQTIRLGLSLADRRHVEAAIVSVTAPGLEHIRRTAVERRLAEAAGERRIPVYIVSGALGPTVADMAEVWGAGLVVIGLGSGAHATAAAIVRNARRCVLAVAPHQSGALHRVMLTADFGGSNVFADECALSLVAADAETELVHIMPDTQSLSPEKHEVWRHLYDSAATELVDYTRAMLPGRRGHVMPTRVLRGDAARDLVAIAQHDHVDLIALGRHPSPPTARDTDLLGPVLEFVLEQAPCSILVAPPISLR